MKLNIGETIMIKRKRKNISQKELGEKVFPDLNFAGTKIKKIELGEQIPTEDDLKKIGAVLGIDFFKEEEEEGGGGGEQEGKEFYGINKKLFTYFPPLKDYIGMLNEAVKIGRPKIIDTIYEEMVEAIRTCKAQDDIKK